MQTNALSRQVALLAEPKTPLESTIWALAVAFLYTPWSTAMRLHYAATALKCKTLGGILRCRLWMQTNAWSSSLASWLVRLLCKHCWLSQRLLWSRACLYEHSGGVGQDHVCAIIADSLWALAWNVWWLFGTHHEALLYTQAIRYTCAYKFTARVKSRA